MQQLLLAVVLAVGGGRRRSGAPAPSAAGRLTQPRYRRAGPARPVGLLPAGGACYLVAVFTSATCQSCAAMARKAAVLTSAGGRGRAGGHQQPALHRKYAIDAVPLVVVADARGVVGASFHRTGLGHGPLGRSG